MRIVSFITLLFLSTLLPVPFVMILFLAYAVVWDGYELLLISAGIDAYFGAGHDIPFYTVNVLCGLVLLVWLKPRLLMYNI